jgi:hypothetical protein
LPSNGQAVERGHPSPHQSGFPFALIITPEGLPTPGLISYGFFFGQAIRLDRRDEPAQQNMRRLFEVDHFGSSNEPVNLGD